MQTFLPLPSFADSLSVLDYRRLGKQRVEALQLIRAISGETTGWRNHPAAVMWRDTLDALKVYHDIAIREWIRRGYRNTMPLYGIHVAELPSWLGDDDFHASHRSNLLRKDPHFYSRYGWTEPQTLPYVWPTHEVYREQ